MSKLPLVLPKPILKPFPMEFAPLGLLTDLMQYLLLIGEVHSLPPAHTERVPLRLHLRPLPRQPVVLRLQLAHLPLVLRNLPQQLAVHRLLIEKLADQRLPRGDPRDGLDVLEGGLDRFELAHLPGHLVPEEPLEEEVRGEDLLPADLGGVLTQLRVLRDFLHLGAAHYAAVVALLLLVDHALQTAQVGLALTGLLLPVRHQFEVDLPAAVLLLPRPLVLVVEHPQLSP